MIFTRSRHQFYTKPYILIKKNTIFYTIGEIIMIIGEKINLRLMEEKDLDEFIPLYNNIENRGDYYYMGMEPESMIRKTYHENGYWTDDFGRFLIVDKSDKILGYINYFKAMNYFLSLEIGYRLFDINSRKKGYMTEAVKMLCKYLFRAKSNINRLVIRTNPDNLASQKVALKSGFTDEGKARGAYLYKNKYIDVCQFAITRQDFYGNLN